MGKLEFIPEDCEFPQLRELLDKEALRQTLQRHMGPAFVSGAWQVADGKIQRMYYKPGADCRVLLMAHMRHRDTREVRQQVFFGTLFRSKSAQAYCAALARKDVARPKFGPAVMHIPEWDMVLWAYPNDPNLPGLPLMVEAEKVLTLAKAAPEQFGLPHAPVAITAEMTKYVPGKRCGYRYHMTLPSTEAYHTDTERPVYGKAYRGSDGARAYAIMQRIWDSEVSQSGRVLLPQPYSYDPTRHILWQEALSGQSFAKVAGTHPRLPEVAEEIGQRLAAFHGAHLEFPQVMTFDFQVAEVQTSIAAINEAFPQHAESCHAVGRKLLATALRLGAGPLTPVHASFKFSHIFATERGIAFIDFDGVNLGDPGYDLGRFVAYLYKMQAEGKLAPSVVKQTVVHFCAAYNHAASTPVQLDRIQWFAASHVLASQVYKGVKRMNAALVSKLLRAAECLCPA